MWVLDAWEDIDVTEDCDVAIKKGLRCLGCKHIPKNEGGNFIIFLKGYKGGKTGVPIARDSSSTTSPASASNFSSSS